MTKRMLDENNEADSLENCADCKWEWSGQFWDLCAKHQREADSHEAEREQWEYRNEFLRG